ncbi:MAG: hypothetical protein WBG61_15240, partial [Desulfobacterales bacterium]
HKSISPPASFDSHRSVRTQGFRPDWDDGVMAPVKYEKVSQGKNDGFEGVFYNRSEDSCFPNIFLLNLDRLLASTTKNGTQD